MGYNLVLRGGRVVDGSGLPSYLADVAIKDGKIAEIERVQGNGGRTIDVHGLVVAPGFIDHHTYMDAQIQWDPYGTTEPQHGITSIVMGNDGLALAPVKSGDEHELVTSFVRFEAMPRHALEKGIPWGWHSYRDYLDSLEGRLGINVGGLVGHVPLRHFVMGQEAADRPAKPAEIQGMKQLVAQAMEDGALGFSTNRNERQMREGERPIPSGLADDEEFFTLCDALGELNAGVIQSHLGQYTIKHFDTYDRLVRRTGRPSVGQPVVHRAEAPERWKQQLDAVAPTFRDGYLPYLRTNTIPTFRHFTLKNAQVFDEFKTWKNLMFTDEEPRKRAFADRQIRHRLHEELKDPRQTDFRWDLVTVEKVANPQNHKYAGKSVDEVAKMRSQDPLDCFSRPGSGGRSGNHVRELHHRRGRKGDGRDSAESLHPGGKFRRWRQDSAWRRERVLHAYLGLVGAGKGSNELGAGHSQTHLHGRLRLRTRRQRVAAPGICSRSRDL